MPNSILTKYYGPFEIIDKVGKVAYRLKLPEGSQIHPVFHVSQLKKSLSKGRQVSPKLPLVSGGGKLRIEPIAILDRRLVKRRNEPIVQLLVRWSNLSDEEARWEDADTIRVQFPEFNLGDKANLKGTGWSWRTRFGGDRGNAQFDFVNARGREGRDGGSSNSVIS